MVAVDESGKAAPSVAGDPHHEGIIRFVVRGTRSDKPRPAYQTRSNVRPGDFLAAQRGFPSLLLRPDDRLLRARFDLAAHDVTELTAVVRRRANPCSSALTSACHEDDSKDDNCAELDSHQGRTSVVKYHMDVCDEVTWELVRHDMHKAFAVQGARREGDPWN